MRYFILILTKMFIDTSMLIWSGYLFGLGYNSALGRLVVYV